MGDKTDWYSWKNGWHICASLCTKPAEADTNSNNVTHLTLNPDVFSSSAIKHSTGLFLEVFNHKLRTKN